MNEQGAIQVVFQYIPLVTRECPCTWLLGQLAVPLYYILLSWWTCREVGCFSVSTNLYKVHEHAYILNPHPFFCMTSQPGKNCLQHIYIYIYLVEAKSVMSCKSNPVDTSDCFILIPYPNVYLIVFQAVSTCSCYCLAFSTVFSFLVFIYIFCERSQLCFLYVEISWELEYVKDVDLYFLKCWKIIHYKISFFLL